MGASAGFFLGPIYAGWRAAGGNWRAPVLEMGLAGVAAAILFEWLAVEVPRGRARDSDKSKSMFGSSSVLALFLAASFLFSLRDFAGSGVGSLGSLFLQKAHGMDPRTTGLAISAVFLAGMVSNPLFGHLSDRRRSRWTALVLCVAAVIVAVFPHVPRQWLIPALGAYGFFFMASYPMVEAALMVSVPDWARGRVFGLFITVGGLVGNLGHLWAGLWVTALGDHAVEPERYFDVYGNFALLIGASLAALPFMRAIRKQYVPAEEKPADVLNVERSAERQPN
jgi:predicted MFS family arabinose efflux permease